jgi:anaerobic selenocysteine-containing dehydrogenase
MNTNPAQTGLTRRSFIKRSVVAAVAVSSMTIFSGLVKAGDNPVYIHIRDGCELSKEADQWNFPDGVSIMVYKCWSSGAICNKDIECGVMYEMDPFTGAPILDPITQKTIWNNIVVNCGADRNPLKYCLRTNIV